MLNFQERGCKFLLVLDVIAEIGAHHVLLLFVLMGVANDGIEPCFDLRAGPRLLWVSHGSLWKIYVDGENCVRIGHQIQEKRFEKIPLFVSYSPHSHLLQIIMQERPPEALVTRRRK